MKLLRHFGSLLASIGAVSLSLQSSRLFVPAQLHWLSGGQDLLFGLAKSSFAIGPISWRIKDSMWRLLILSRKAFKILRMRELEAWKAK